MREEQTASADPLLFEAVIAPHRSLSRRGLIILLSVIAGLCGLTMLRFWVLGAWPVVAFSLVEVGIAAGLLILNARQARGSELVMLTENCVRVVRTDSRGRQQRRLLSAAWLNVVLVESPGRIPRLLLSARDAREEIGAVLGEAEKRDLATALLSALHKARNPQFDNPQLRDR